MVWKKNLRFVPPAILETARSLRIDDCQAACVKRITEAELRNGDYRHLGIGFDGQPVYEGSSLPPAAVGRYSHRNVYGYEKKFTDEPKVQKTWSVTTPNFGDWSKGSHDVPVDREVYRREYFPPPFLPIEIDCLGEDLRRPSYTFSFKVGRTLNRRSPRFEDDLLFDLNLLQENVGNHGVVEAGTTSEEFLRSLYVDWEILPPGERDDNIARILGGLRSNDPQVRARLVERYDFLSRLKPRNFVKGTSGFARYFGAQFADDLVVFENVEYGNAAYVMFEDWGKLSQRSRTDLLASEEDFVRITHTATWKPRLRAEIARRLAKGRQR